MTSLSPTQMGVASEINDKGSTYGKASRTSPSPHSFHQQQRSCGLVYSNRAEVLSNETVIS